MKPQEFHAKWVDVKAFVEAVMEARKASLQLEDEPARHAREYLLSAMLGAIRLQFGIDTWRIPHVRAMQRLYAVTQEPELRDLLFETLVDQRASDKRAEEEEA